MPFQKKKARLHLVIIVFSVCFHFFMMHLLLNQFRHLYTKVFGLILIFPFKIHLQPIEKKLHVFKILY